MVLQKLLGDYHGEISPHGISSETLDDIIDNKFAYTRMRGILILILGAWFSCSSGSTQKQELLAVSKPMDFIYINNESSDQNRFYYLDDFGEINFLKKNNTISSDGDRFQIFDGRFKVSYILEKGDSVKIIQADPFCRVETADRRRNVELSFLVEFFKQFEKDQVDRLIFKKALIEQKYINDTNLRDSLFGAEQKAGLDFLRSFTRSHELSDGFFELHKNIIQYKVLEKQMFLGNAKFPDSYVKSLFDRNMRILGADQYLFLSHYRNSVNYSFHDLRRCQPGKEQSEIIANNFSDETKRYLLANLLVNSKRGLLHPKLSASEAEALKSALFTDRQQSRFKDYIAKMQSMESIALKEDEITDFKGQRRKFSKLAGGKITYIDFWASWCLPCRVEMPYSKKLSQIYKGKGIDFVYISIDKNAAAWEKAARQEDIPQLQSFLIPDSKKSDIVKKFGVWSIPRYMIMNQKGEIVDSNAPRPSDPELINVLNKYLH